MSLNVLKKSAFLVAAGVLSGCVLFDDTRRVGPDEFGVVSRAPLSQPPDFALRPPRAGAERPNEVTPREQARSKLLSASGRRDRPAGAAATGANGGNGANGASGNGVAAGAEADAMSPGEMALLKEAGALGIDPDIRTIVNRESGRVTEDESLVDSLVFWRSKENSGNRVVDPDKEASRLNRNAAIGAPPTASQTEASPTQAPQAQPDEKRPDDKSSK